MRFFLITAGLITLVFAAPHDRSKTKDKTNEDVQFDYFVYAQVWQPAMCHVANLEHPGSCDLPVGITDWTVHGLWPTKYTEHEGPSNCDQTQPFDESQITDLMPAMLQQWPNVATGGQQDDFWSHEWTKHGTCAETLPITSGEHNYFGQSLLMNTQNPVGKYLEQAGVVQSASATYTLEQIEGAVEKVTGKKGVVACLTLNEGGTRSYFVEEIRICFDKSFVPIDCPDNNRHHQDGHNQSYFTLPNQMNEFRQHHGGGKNGGGNSLPDVSLCPADQPIYYQPVGSSGRSTV